MSAAESWFAPAAVAQPLPGKRPQRRTPTPAKPTARKPRAAQKGRSFRVRAPLVWMVLFALLLVGVVTLNVAVLRANVSVNDLDRQIGQVEQENARLSSRYSSVLAAPRVEKAAGKDGLVLAPSADPG